MGELLKYYECPTEYQPHNFRDPSVFLAGGITGCPDWQQEMIKFLWDINTAIINPRRVNFPIDDPAAAEKQISWEHRHLRKARTIMFWFPKETLCPIVLYELGAWSMHTKPIFVGVHPEYARRKDVEIQTKLARPEVTVVYSLESLACEYVHWYKARYYDAPAS